VAARREKTGSARGCEGTKSEAKKNPDAVVLRARRRAWRKHDAVARDVTRAGVRQYLREDIVELSHTLG